MRSLIFDTETTGLPEYTKKHDDPDQPYAVQLGMEITDDAKREVLTSVHVLIKVEKESSSKAFEVHRKTPKLLLDFGLPPRIVTELFLLLASKVDRLVAHYVDFDEWIMKCQCARLDLSYPTNIPTFCTMKNSKRKGTHAGQQKWPKLMEIYRELVDPKGFADAHDTSSDVPACRKVFWALLDEQEGKTTRKESKMSSYVDGDESKDYDVDEIKVDRKMSWLVVLEGEEFWLPKSQCTLSEDETTIEIPNWLAQKNGFYEE